MQLNRIAKIPIDRIVVRERLRGLDEKEVSNLAESLRAIGLRHPISVSQEPGAKGGFHLGPGLHRLRAAQRLGWDEIDAEIIDEHDRRLWEIAENLHRSPLTKLERDRHIAEWVRITNLRAQEKPGQVAQVSEAARHKGGRGNAGGISAAARELGITRESVRRALAISKLTPEAGKVAAELGLDNNESALLRAARAPANKQVATLRQIANVKPERNNKGRTRQQPQRKPAPRARVSQIADARRRRSEDEIRRLAQRNAAEHIKVYDADQLKVYLDAYTKAVTAAIKRQRVQ